MIIKDINTTSAIFIERHQFTLTKSVNFINENVLQEGMTASLVDAVEEDYFYKVSIKIGDNEFDSYATKDGKLLFPELPQFFELDKEITEPESDITKTDKPDVKVFVMSYCPYGLQAQKMFLPVFDLLKDKADIGIYFVDYIMHDKEEIDENLRQYCIAQQEEEKFSDYLKCFVVDGEFEKCLSATGIDATKLAGCVSETDTQYKITEQYHDKSTWLSGRYPLFGAHADLNEQYGVGGSPTIVINDSVIVSNAQQCPEGEFACVVVPDLQRSPESFKTAVCSAFNLEPEECAQTLSSDTPVPSFGAGASDSGSGGQCK